MQGEIKARQIEGPSGLLLVEFLGHHEVLQVLVVGLDLGLMTGSLQEMPPLFQCTDNGEHLFVVNLIVSFHCVQAFGVEGNGMPFPIAIRKL